MSVEDLMLHFDYDEHDEKQFYLPGDVLRGKVFLHLRMSLRVRTMSLHVQGGAAVSWEVPGKKKIYSAREVYLQGVIKMVDAGADHPLLLDRGVHEFTFYYQLPPDLPSTYSGIYGSVSYVAKVILDPEDGASATVTSEPFMVFRRPALPPDTFADKDLKASKMFVGFLRGGEIKLQCNISRTAAIPGDIIYINAEVSNWSPRSITHIQAAIVLESTYRAHNSRKTIVFRQIINKRVDVFDVRTLRGRRWRNVQMHVPPFIPDSNLEGCSIIDICYFFEYRVQIAGKDDLVARTPLWVGGHPIETRLVHGVSGVRDSFHADAYSVSHKDLPWYGGDGGGWGTISESVDGDSFELR